MTELYLPPIKPHKRTARPKINWDGHMILYLTDNFATTFNRDLSAYLKVSFRSVIRKARELGLEKELDFLVIRRDVITKMATEAHPPHPHTGDHSWYIPNSEKYRFKPGNLSIMKLDPDVVKRCHVSRNKTIHSERLRIKYGLPQKTKLKLDPYKL